MGRKRTRTTVREFYLYVFGLNAIWVVIPMLGLYVSVRLILDGNYSVLGM